MAQISYRANLSAAIFPMTLARSGRSVIIAGPDQNFNRSIDSPDDSNRDAGIPQIIYGENILPTADGYQSIGYKQEVSTFPGLTAYQRKSLDVRIPVAGLATVEVNLQLGALDVYAYNSGAWQLVTLSGAWTYNAGDDVTTAFVNGICYLYTGSNLYTVDFSAGPVTITNITASVLPVGFLTGKVSMCGAYNYLIFCSRDTVYWSSTTLATDFTPSLISGSGSGRINSTAGNAKYLRATSFGFLVYCESNVVAATYTGNSRYPWRFVPINDSEGIGSHVQISGRFTDAVAYVITNRGTLQQVGSGNAQLIGQEVSELLERLKYTDSFDYVNNTFSVVARSGTVSDYFKLSYINNRYLIISLYRGDIPNPSYSEAIVYDTYFKRYGKIDIAHTSITEVQSTTDNIHKILLVNSVTGKSYQLIQNIADTSVTMQGVLVLGKFQYVRSRFLCLDELAVESAQLNALVPANQRNFSAYVLPTLDGKTFEAAQSLYTVADQTNGDVQTYYSSAEGKNISLLIKGAFDICSVDMTFHIGGTN